MVVPPPDRGAANRGDDWLVEVHQRLHEGGLWRFAGPRRILEEILDIVARAERFSSAVPEHDTRVVVVRRLIEDARECHVHGRRHGIPLGRAVQLDAQDASCVFGNDIVHVELLIALVNSLQVERQGGS
jgi:hypothetical protein